jgi:hypothetical protein
MAGRQQHAQDFLNGLDALLKEGRANGYTFVVLRDQGKIAVSRNLKPITTFELSQSGLGKAQA